MNRLLLTLLSVAALSSFGACDSADDPVTAPIAGDNCGCGDAACGFDLCGNSCGTCQGPGMDPEMAMCSAGQCVDSTTCSDELIGFSPTAEAAYNQTTAGKTLLYYVASTGNGDPPFEKVVVELNHEKFFAEGEPMTGVFDLSEQDPNDCALCVRAYSYCNENDCFNKYVADSGEIELVASGQPGTPFTGRFRGLKLREVLIDKSNGKFKEHPNPKTYCMGDFHFDTAVPELKTADSSCVAEGTGKDLGDNIADFTLTNCLGEEINLHSRCGLYNAVWVVATAGWCGACTAWVPKVGEEYTKRKDDGLDIMIVIGETSTGAAPSLEYCYQYATDKGIDPRQTFVDNQSRSWGVTFDNINTYGDSIALPWQAVLDGSSMEYLWNSSVGEGNVLDQVNSALK